MSVEMGYFLNLLKIQSPHITLNFKPRKITTTQSNLSPLPRIKNRKEVTKQNILKTQKKVSFPLLLSGTRGKWLPILRRGRFLISKPLTPDVASLATCSLHVSSLTPKRTIGPIAAIKGLKRKIVEKYLLPAYKMLYFENHLLIEM